MNHASSILPFSRAVASRRLALAALVLALAATVAASVAPQARAAAPPRDFMGVTSWDPPTGADFQRLGAANVRLYRMLVLWSKVEPRPPSADGTHHYDWSYYDRVFAQAAQNGVRILPLLHGSPRWVAKRPQLQPKTEFTRAAFAAFANAAAKRYGPDGTFWSGAPWSSSAPAPANLRALYWQVWNEPNTPDNWSPRPRPIEYAQMLKRVGRALKQASPRVRVMSAGLVWPYRGMAPEPYLARMLAVPGVRDSVDIFAVHPYGTLVYQVLQRLSSARSTLDSHGAASKPLWITETGWGTGKYDGWFTVPPDTQASNLDNLYRQLLATRGSYKLLGATWFAYRDYRRRLGQAYYWGYYAGLLRADNSPKPAWGVFVRRAQSGY